MARRAPLCDIGNTQRLPFAPTRLDKPPPVLNQSRSTPSDDIYRQNHLHVAHYVPEIMETLRRSEGKFMANSGYMGHQTDINEKMRSILVDWLVDVHLKFKLSPETLYLAVSLVDRFLDQKIVTRSKLQLVGVVAMLLAAKYEEIYPPEIRDFIYISANTYTKEDIIKMERLMLGSLDFSLTSPSIYPFLKRAVLVADVDQTCQFLALYISELAMLDYRSLQYSPSMIAAACVYLAQKIRKHPEPWNWMLEHYTSYSTSALQGVAALLYEVIQGAALHRCQASRKKYAHPQRYNCASELADVPLVFP